MGTIKVNIDKFGNPKIEAVGFVGRTCETATASLEAAFKQGAAEVKTDRRPEYYQTVGGASVNKVGQ